MLVVQSAWVIRKHLVQIVQIKLVRMKSVYAEMYALKDSVDEAWTVSSGRQFQSLTVQSKNEFIGLAADRQYWLSQRASASP